MSNENKETKRPIKEEWAHYYNFLEALRRTGVCNMWGASVYLEEAFKLSKKEAGEILCNWIDNYSALNEKYEWDNPPIKKD
jgi:hypothetical protein